MRSSGVMAFINESTHLVFSYKKAGSTLSVTTGFSALRGDGPFCQFMVAFINITVSINETKSAALFNSLCFFFYNKQELYKFFALFNFYLIYNLFNLLLGLFFANQQGIFGINNYVIFKTLYYNKLFIVHTNHAV